MIRAFLGEGAALISLSSIVAIEHKIHQITLPSKYGVLNDLGAKLGV